ncbi:MAG: GTP 3',8-cyclase MoaA [Actinomycetia bacterium]|nr:GTP 3',8-cyclase MoaA [Actinomycetes bacterium]
MSLIDGYDRQHRDLRVSVTDKCSLRCAYCMPAEGLPWLPSQEILSQDELIRLVGLAVQSGISSVRLTGGEPLLRTDIVEIVHAIKSLRDAPSVAMTTNGLRLTELAQDLATAGLDRVNVSLDTLQPDRFAQMTRRNQLPQTLAGIAAAQAAGLEPVKVNAVLLRDVNQADAADLLAWALTVGVQLRFIEQMPLDPQHSWTAADFVSVSEILAQLTSAGFRLIAQPRRDAAPASQWRITEVPAGITPVDSEPRLGVVASVSDPFCGSCDRLRLTADGQFRSCLFARKETDLRTPLRAGASDAELLALMRLDLAAKARGHGIDEPGFTQPDRPMSAIGG